MTETMKAAWIGLIGAILGAVLGAVLAVIGTTYYSDWLYGPKEGVFSVDVTKITAANLEPALRDQITRYPGSLIVRHIDGPAIEDITVIIHSKYSLDSLNMVRNDENAVVTFSDDKKTLRVDIPKLRKGSSVQYDFLSLGPPEFEKAVTMSFGRLAENIQKPVTVPWYQTDTFIIVMILLISAIVVLFVFLFVGRSLFVANGTLTLSNRTLRFIALVLAALAILPFSIPFHLSDVFVIIMLAAIYIKITEK